FSSRRRHTRLVSDWSSDVCSSDLNHIANLDVAPGFTAATPVLPGAAGAFNGTFPASLNHPDRNDFAPRIGIAWRPLKNTVVRTRSEERRGGKGVKLECGTKHKRKI